MWGDGRLPFRTVGELDGHWRRLMRRPERLTLAVGLLVTGLGLLSQAVGWPLGLEVTAIGFVVASSGAVGILFQIFGQALRNLAGDASPRPEEALIRQGLVGLVPDADKIWNSDDWWRVLGSARKGVKRLGITNFRFVDIPKHQKWTIEMLKSTLRRPEATVEFVWLDPRSRAAGFLDETVREETYRSIRAFWDLRAEMERLLAENQGAAAQDDDDPAARLKLTLTEVFPTCAFTCVDERLAFVSNYVDTDNRRRVPGLFLALTRPRRLLSPLSDRPSAETVAAQYFQHYSDIREDARTRELTAEDVDDLDTKYQDSPRVEWRGDPLWPTRRMRMLAAWGDALSAALRWLEQLVTGVVQRLQEEIAVTGLALLATIGLLIALLLGDSRAGVETAQGLQDFIRSNTADSADGSGQETIRGLALAFSAASFGVATRYFFRVHRRLYRESMSAVQARAAEGKKDNIRDGVWRAANRAPRAFHRTLGVANKGFLLETAWPHVAEDMRGLLANRVPVEILWLDPRSSKAEEREQMEQHRATREDTIKSILRFVEFKKSLTPAQQGFLKLCVHDRLPTCSLTWSDGMMLASQYLYFENAWAPAILYAEKRDWSEIWVHDNPRDAIERSEVMAKYAAAYAKASEDCSEVDDALARELEEKLPDVKRRAREEDLKSLEALRGEDEGSADADGHGEPEAEDAAG